MGQGPRPKMPQEPSLRIAQNEAMKSGKVPTEMGLLPETYIPALKYPWEGPRNAVLRRWYAIFYPLRDRVARLVFQWSAPYSDAGERKRFRKFRFGTRVVKFTNGEAAREAKRLHEEMYMLFSQGKKALPKLQKICCEGLFESYSARVAIRAPKEVWEWSVRYEGKPKVVVDKIAMLSMDGAAVRQAVVRIVSTQTLVRMKGDTTVAKGEKKVTENVVLQKIFQGWKEENWQVWGTAKATTMRDVQAWKDALK